MNSRLPPTTADLTQASNDPSDLEDRLNAVQDFSSRLRSEVALLQRNLSRVKRQQFMRREIGHLLEEEAFFGERGFIHGSSGRARDESTAALARTATEKAAQNDSGLDAESVAEAGEIDGGLAEAPELPSEVFQDPVPEVPAEVDGMAEFSSPEVNEGLPSELEAPSDSMPRSLMHDVSMSSSEPVLEGLPRLEMSSSVTLHDSAESEGPSRDPLIQLALEFGLDAEHLPSLFASSGSSYTNQVRWLSERLHTTQAILKKLEQLATELRSRLHAAP